jgi:predicted phosphodiesterase
MTEVHRELLVPDIHAPYQDQRAVDLLLKVGDTFKFDGLTCLGDLLDNYAISSFAKVKNRKLDWQWEIDSAVAIKHELEVIAPTRTFCVGNHEFRTDKMFATDIPQDNRRNVNDIETILELKGWDVVPYREAKRIGKLWVTHDVGYCGANAVGQTLNAVQSNIAFGHTHRMGTMYAGDVLGGRYVGTMLGWLGDMAQIDYAYRLKVCKDWQLGFGIAYIEPNGNAHVQAIPMVDYTCMVEGQLIRG